MKYNSLIFSKLKKLGWDNRQEWLAAQSDKSLKFLSTYAINAAIEEPKDWNAIATKCSENPNHEMFGVPLADILANWKSRGAKGQARGVSLDDYITAKLSGLTFDTTQFNDDTLMLAKIKHFDTLNEKFISKLHSYVGSEIWLTSKKLGACVRLDSLFTINNDSRLLIAEWKNNEALSTSNSWQKFIGPASHLQACDINKFTIQTHVYRYILEEYGIFDEVFTKVFNITSNNYIVHNENFAYDAKFIEELCTFTRSKQTTN